MTGARVGGALVGDQTATGVSVLKDKTLGGLASYPQFLFVVFLLTIPLLNPWVRGDGVGYYSYLRSALVDHDLNFENDYLGGNQSFVMSRIGADGRLLPELYTKTGHVENHFTVGPAMLWAPVLIPVHLGVLALNHVGIAIKADGYSRPYVLGMALTTAVYGFLSLLLAFRVARKYFDQHWAFLATLGIWLASSLPVYMYFNPSWSHALSAFSVALFLWYWDRTQLRRTMGQWIILGLMAGLMGDVYYPNIILLIFPGLEALFLLRGDKSDSAKPAVPLGKLFSYCAAFGAAIVVAILPTFITRQIIYGSPLATGYPKISTWHWTSPLLGQVLFSADHGMWSWTPILFFAVVGLFFLHRKNALLGAASLVTFLAYYYFIASYPDWDGLSSFGNRFFVSLTPIFILGLTSLLDAFAKVTAKPSRAAGMAAAVIALLTIWNVGFIFQWGTHMVPARGKISWPEMVHNQFVEVPLRLKHSLETYFLHRKDMMQHIEQEDIEQQKVQPNRED